MIHFINLYNKQKNYKKRYVHIYKTIKNVDNSVDESTGWDRQWSPPSIVIFSHKCWCVYRIYKTTQSYKFQSDLSYNCFTIDVWKLNCYMQLFILLIIDYWLLLFVSHFTQVPECFDMWYVGKMFDYRGNIYLRQ